MPGLRRPGSRPRSPPRRLHGQQPVRRGRRRTRLLLPRPGLAERFAAARANAQTRQPELLQLGRDVAALKRARKQTARDHAATVRELEATIRVYANQIQVLALRNAGLEEQARHLRRLARADTDVIPLPDRS